MNILAIIPARSGSKGLKNKNIKLINGKPLIAWSISQVLASKHVSQVYVSTDSQTIADISKSYGAQIPFIRPAYLAEDDTPTSDVILHTIEELTKQGKVFSHVMLIEPTSPLRETSDIDAAIEELLNKSYAKSIVGISKVESQHPSFCVSLTSDNLLRSKNDFIVLRRQDINELYFYDGSIYLSEIHTYIDKKNFYHEHTLGYIMPKYKSFEIDDEIDFDIVEMLMKKYNYL